MSIIISNGDVSSVGLLFILIILIGWLEADMKQREGGLPLIGKKKKPELLLAL